MTKRKRILLSAINHNRSKKVIKCSTNVSRIIIYKYDIDPYQYNDDFLINCAIDMFIYYNLLIIYDIKQNTLYRFLHKVNELYLSDNYFHNFKHAWSVLHASFQILIHGGDKLLEPLDILAVLISSICHDLRHPGNNNAFELATHSTLSQLYNSISSVGSRPILEHHHLTSTLNLLNESNLLMNLSDDIEKELFYREVSIIILGTDMAQHNIIVNELKSYANLRKTRNGLSSRDSNICNSRSKNNYDIVNKLVSKKYKRKEENIYNEKSSSRSSSNSSYVEEANECKKIHEHDGSTDEESKSSSGEDSTSSSSSSSSSGHVDFEPHPIQSGVFIRNDPESRIIFTRALVHTADLSAQTQSLPIAVEWMNRCQHEFRSQALKEVELGIMTSSYLHNINENCHDYLSQYQFIHDFVEPLWKAITMILPNLNLPFKQLLSNKDSYKELHENKNKNIEGTK